jgi:hypothetical protein
MATGAFGTATLNAEAKWQLENFTLVFKEVPAYRNNLSMELQRWIGLAFVAFIFLMFMLSFMLRLCPAGGPKEAESMWLAEFNRQERLRTGQNTNLELDWKTIIAKDVQETVSRKTDRVHANDIQSALGSK